MGPSGLEREEFDAGYYNNTLNLPRIYSQNLTNSQSNVVYNIKTNEVCEFKETDSTNTSQREPFSGCWETVVTNTTLPRPSWIFPPDDRTYVSATTNFPWRTIFKLYVTCHDGYQFVATGAMIDNFHVLTYGTCVYSHSHGGWA
ncbi:MAG: hypothetical protein JW776_14680 [Candidatus Lokiarchaeota archaeon]|nr:hypothetical protein [Candidatus Lokiarchaeota archaeon]